MQGHPIFCEHPEPWVIVAASLHARGFLGLVACWGVAAAPLLASAFVPTHAVRIPLNLVADGKGSEAAHWFDRLGFGCPFGTNIADWILDLASGEVAGKHS